MNHWAETDRRNREWLAARMGIELPPELARPRLAPWQRRARERAIRRIARIFRVPRHLLVPRLATPPYKRNARRYGR